MATPKLFNRVKHATSTTGAGTATLGAASTGYATAAEAGVANGDTVFYTFEDGSDFEIGIGTYTSSGTTLSRDTVLLSKIAGTAGTSKLNLSGSATVFFTAPRESLLQSGYNAPANLGLAASAGSSALTIAVKGADGNDPSATNPVLVWLRSATGTTGTPVPYLITAAMSLVISSGSTLGVTSSTAFRLWAVLFDDAGTLRPGVINCSTASQIYPLGDDAIASSTAEGGAGAADSAGVFYTGTGVTSKAYRILGYLEWSSSGLTAGTWTTTNLTRVQLFGPDTKKPGDVVQEIYATDTGTGTATTTTQVQTTSTQAITPKSAANLIGVTVNGTLCSETSSQYGKAQLSRGTTPTLIGNQAAAIQSAGAGIVEGPCTLWALDKPNTASAQSYYVFVVGGGAGSFKWNRIPTTVSWRLQEIMG